MSMVRFIIHGEVDGFEDSVVVEGEDIEEVRRKASEEVDTRGWTNCWSEPL